MMTLDSVLPLVAAVLATPLTLLLIARRVCRTLPIFVAYLGYTFVTGFAGAWAIEYAPTVYFDFWALFVCVDLTLYLCVLVELGKNVRTHNQRGDSQWPIAILVFPLVTLAFWSLTPWPVLPRSGWIWQINFRALQALAVLQMSGLFTLLLWSSIWKLHWPERELRIVTGIGIWTVVQFAVLIVHTHGLLGGRYHWLDLLTPACCIIATAYWLHYFWLEPKAAAMPGEQGIADAAIPSRRNGPNAFAIPRVM
jgi:hypothetical protein